MTPFFANQHPYYVEYDKPNDKIHCKPMYQYVNNFIFAHFLTESENI